MSGPSNYWPTAFHAWYKVNSAMDKKILAIAFWFVLMGMVIPLAAQTSPDCSRLKTLLADLDRGRRTALPEFWTEIAAQGAPLVEPAGNDTDLRLVTFIWRATEPVKNVVLRGAFLSDPSRNGMERLRDTDLWFKSLRLPNGLRGVYGFSPNLSLTSAGQPLPPYRPDPLNRHTLIYAKDPDNHKSVERAMSLLEMPGAAPQPYINPRPGVPTGEVRLHRIKSAILKDERRIWVYTPPGYSAAGPPHGLLFVFDGFVYTTTVPTPTILDNLIAQKRIPPLVAVFVDNPSPEARRQLDNYPPFAEFMAAELLPWVRANFRVTHDPALTTLAGSSGGGQASMCVALRHPELFGSVLSQSGSFFDTPDTYGDEWVFRQIVTRPRLPLRFYLDVGRFEGNDGPVCTRSMRNVLEAKGYPVAYAEFDGGHDYSCWRGTLADGLMALYGPVK
jgi:enterochelin esterase-like enzyme